MQILRYSMLPMAVFLSLYFLVAIPSAFANSGTLSVDPSYAQGPFQFYCPPYKTSFEEGKHYLPQNGPCMYSIPQSILPSGIHRVVTFRGVVGSSTVVSGDMVYIGATLAEVYPTDFETNYFPHPKQDDDFFSIVCDGFLITELLNYFQTGGPLPASAVQNQNFYILKWKWGTKPASEYDPVIIIPGILGSWQKNGNLVLDPILHTYDNLIDTLLANGYIENKTLFRFPYDWESPNEETAFILKNKIAEIKTICACSKVDIIAHSMGGLVATNYVQRDDYAHDVDQLFLVATPLSGAPLAYPAWEAGEIKFGDFPTNAFMQTKFKAEALKHGYLSVFDYIRGKPIVSIQELLPVFNDYLKTNTATLHYPIGYPVNSFLERIVANFDRKVYFSNIRTKLITANNRTDSTTAGFVVASSSKAGLWEHGEPVNSTFGVGDGTVPRWSVDWYNEPDKEFDFENHTGIASTSTPYIFKELTDKDPDIIVGKTYSVVKSFLKFTLLSPIDMQIIAPDGKRFGKDFTNNTELNEIPDAFYSGFNTDDEYAIIPNPLPGTYQLKTIGTESGGDYTIIVDHASTATASEVQTSGTTLPGQIISNVVVVSSTTSTVTIQPQVPPVVLTPDTCVVDMTTAYQSKWINKKAVYEKLIFDCKALKELFKVRDKIQQITPAKQDKLAKLLLAATLTGIKLTLADMDLLAKDKSNTKDAVELITKYTTWFRAH